uniref:Uncharacterized protein n=1 Tax=Arundo donax TaxID=35708 RepID=A0A0A9B017_ARUDO
MCFQGLWMLWLAMWAILLLYKLLYLVATR